MSYGPAARGAVYRIGPHMTSPAAIASPHRDATSVLSSDEMVAITAQRAFLLRRGLHLELLTVGWNVGEGVIAIAAVSRPEARP